MIISGRLDAPLLLLAHGAGAGCASPFMTAMTAALEASGIRVARFDFAYMARRIHEGRRQPPPRIDVLVGEFQKHIETATARAGAWPVFIGGKSMGGRIASLLADNAFADGAVTGCVCVSYPFHPAGSPEKLRTAHLRALRCPTLIVQGTRDPLGSQEDVAGYELSPAISLHWLQDGDHDLKPRRASGFTHAQHLHAAATAIAAFMAPKS